MGIRRFALAAGAAALLALGAAPASAGPTDLVLPPFTATGTIFNNAPPNRIGEIRFYVHGTVFTLKPITSASANLGPRVAADGALGIYVTPVVTSFTMNGAATDYDGAMIEGCTASVTGVIVQLPTQVARDQLQALTVDSTCP